MDGPSRRSSLRYLERENFEFAKYCGINWSTKPRGLVTGKAPVFYVLQKLERDTVKYEKKFKVDCPEGMYESWDKFPWAKYPGGVDVTFALAKERSLFLVKEGRHCYVMPKIGLERGKVLADLVSQVPGGNAEVYACYDDGCTFHVLVLVQCYGAGNFKEINNYPLLLSGYASGNPMAAYAARVLGWSDSEVEKHLPLPQPALALAA